jgi:hypothetical protein
VSFHLSRVNAAGCNLACYFQTKPIWPGAVFDPASSPVLVSTRATMDRGQRGQRGYFASKVPPSVDAQPAACTHPSTSAKAIRRRPGQISHAFAHFVHVGGEPSESSHVSTASAVRQCPVTHHDICEASAQPRDKFGLTHARRLGGASVVLCRACLLRRACACAGFRPAQKRGFDGIHSCGDTRTGARPKPITPSQAIVLLDAASPTLFKRKGRGKGEKETGNLRGDC